jgi:hypothetical protein
MRADFPDLVPGSLSHLANRFGTDKGTKPGDWGIAHGYAAIYERFLGAVLDEVEATVIQQWKERFKGKNLLVENMAGIVDHDVDLAAGETAHRILQEVLIGGIANQDVGPGEVCPACIREVVNSDDLGIRQVGFPHAE